jgi:hypothetical protein
MLLIVGLGVLLNHMSWREKDRGYVWVVDEQELDVLGIVHDKWSKLIRTCAHVTHIPPKSPQHLAIEKLIQDYSPPGSNSAQIRSLQSMGNWALAEVEFDELLPAVVLLQHVKGEAHILSHAIWSGYTSPWEPAPFIRNYLSTQAPHAPIPLIECFDPKTRFLTP